MGWIVMLYGIVSYAVFFVVFLYAIAFVGNLDVPRTIDTPAAVPAGTALAIDMVLLGLFAIQHSLMARPAFKRAWTRFVPVAIERSTYVLISSLLLALLFWQWQGFPGKIWDLTQPMARAALWGLYALGWLIVLTSTFMINHFDLFGLRQSYLRMRGLPYSHLPFTQAALYRVVRHPIMLGFVIAFWATPTMTWGHLLFAIATTGYIIIGVMLEERDLVTYHGEAYLSYRKSVPMLLPLGSLKRT